MKLMNQKAVRELQYI